MLTLPVYRALPYVSPSTFLTWKKCQYKVYMTKMAGNTFPDEQAGEAAMIGIAFDAYVKDVIIKRLGLFRPAIQSLSEMLRNCSDSAKKRGKDIAAKYIQCPLFEKIYRHSEVLVEQEITANIGGIPLLGRVDLLINKKPMDWKLRGFASVSKTYPTKGYVRIYKWYGDKWLEAPNKVDNINKKLEDAHPDWATQMLFYNWILANDPRPAIIHELVGNGEDITVVEHEDYITDEFSDRVRKDLETMWEACTGMWLKAQIDTPIPTKWVCEGYGSLCQVAHVCRYYQSEMKGNL